MLEGKDLSTVEEEIENIGGYHKQMTIYPDDERILYGLLAKMQTSIDNMRRIVIQNQ